MNPASFQDLLRQAPLVMRQVFLHLPVEDLTTCLNDVHPVWTEFIRCNLLANRDSSKAISRKAKRYQWLKSPYTEHRLDCHLEMRSSDLQEIKGIWCEGHQIFVLTAVTDRFRKTRQKDHFLFIYDESGQISDEYNPPLGQIGLRDAVSEISFTHQRIFVRYCASDYDASFDVFLRADSDDYAKEEITFPKINSVASVLCSADSAYLIAKENSQDSYLMFYELVDQESEFNEHCLIDDIDSIVGLRILLKGDKFIFWDVDGNFLAVFDHVNGEQIWRESFDRSDHRIVVQESLINQRVIAVKLIPKDFSRTNSLIMIHDLTDGENIYSLEISSDPKSMNLFNCSMDETRLVVTYKDEFTSDSVLKMFDLEKKCEIFTIHDFLFFNSLMLLDKTDLALVTFHNARESKDGGAGFGTLAVIDLAQENFPRAFKDARNFFEVALKTDLNEQSLKFGARIAASNNRFLCVKRRGQACVEVTCVDMEMLKIGL